MTDYFDTGFCVNKPSWHGKELLLTEEDNGASALTYVVPSSLMVVEPNPPLLAAARDLDDKLAALASKVTASQ